MVKLRERKLVMSDGRYETERVIGSGGMATVFRGHDEFLDRPVAIKLLADNLASDEDFHARFMQEARHAGKLNHPNIVQVFDVSEFEGRPFIVMEYVPGKTLAEVLAKQGPLREEEAVELALQAAAGLEHAHRAGVVHRDIKPQNLLIRDDGTLKIVDFGIARAAEDKHLTQTGAVIGTRPYLAPEQERGGRIGPPVDVYQLGVVISEMVGGQASPALTKVVQRCLEPQPRKRYSSAVGLRRALAGLASTRKGKPAIAGLLGRTRSAIGGMLSKRTSEETTRLLDAEPKPTKKRSAGKGRKRIEIPATLPAIKSKARVGRGLATAAAVIAAVAVLTLGVLLATSIGGGSGGDADKAKAGGVPELSSDGDPAKKASALADWLRSQGGD
jgi:serine/threonine-protein kinase